MCDIERSNPNVGVGQILKGYLNTSGVTLFKTNAELEHGFK